MKRLILLALALAPAACGGHPQQLPIGVSSCSAAALPAGLSIVARIENKSDRPISQIEIESSFYQNFRYQKLAAFAQLKEELDPGQTRNVTFAVAQAPAPQPRGQAMRCFVTHIRYLDGTSQEAPPNQ